MRAVSLTAAALAAAAFVFGQPKPECSLVPGWQQQGAARTHNAENLFEYMNGNAEGYLIYGFKAMNGVTCQQGDKVLVIDIFEMNDPDSAYGLFTANHDPKLPVEKLGMTAQVAPRRGALVKGNYYAEMAANPEGDHSAAVRAFLVAMEKQISGRTTLPDALSWFPKEKLTSLRLVPESVLGMRVLKRGYAAQYEYGKAFLVREATPEAATGVMQKLRGRFTGTGPAQVGQEAFQVNDKYLGRLCFFRKGMYLGGYANVAEGQDPVALAKALAEKLQ